MAGALKEVHDFDCYALTSTPLSPLLLTVRTMDLIDFSVLRFFESDSSRAI